MALVTQAHLRSRKIQECDKSDNGKKRTKNKRRRMAHRCAVIARGDKEDSYADMYAAAQEQMKREMIAIGLEGCLPMSFGSTSTWKKHKRALETTPEQVLDTKDVVIVKSKQTQTVVGCKERMNDGDGSNATASDVSCAPPPHNHDDESLILETTSVDKVRVVYDSDGEVAKKFNVRVEMRSAATSEQHSVECTLKKSSIAKKKKKYPVPRDVVKFYVQRHILFEKFEDGIQLDHESWYSVTPQVIAEHIATRLSCDVVVDPFAGCGGNVIQLAMTCKHVIAIDIDPDKIYKAKHNAAIYGVADKIEWIVGNSIEILHRIKADAVFLSPPWGGVAYNRKHFRLEDMIVKGVSGLDLFAMARKVSKNIAYYLPRSTCTNDLAALAPTEHVECEQIYLNKQLKVLIAYYGDLTALKPHVVQNPLPIEDPDTREESK